MDALTLILIFTAALVVVALVAWLVVYRRNRYEARLERALARATTARASELTIPDGMDGQIHVPHVLRTAAGFVVLDVVRVDGAVFGGERMDEWTVLVGGRARKFRNPTMANQARVHAVEHLIPGLPVHGMVVLLGEVEFPKGRPDGVVTLAALEEGLASLPLCTPMVGDWDEAWFGLRACATVPPDAV